MIRLGPIHVLHRQHFPSDFISDSRKDFFLEKSDNPDPNQLNMIADSVLGGIGVNLICSDLSYAESIAELIRNKCEEYIHSGLFKGPCGYNSAVCCHWFENGECAIPW